MAGKAGRLIYLRIDRSYPKSSNVNDEYVAPRVAVRKS